MMSEGPRFRAQGPEGEMVVGGVRVFKELRGMLAEGKG
jgi:hypothetical protein